MKKIKIICLIAMLIIANIYILISVAFEIKYANLIEEYNELSVGYYELQEQYIAQEEKLQTVMAQNRQDSKVSIKEYINKIFNSEDTDFTNLTYKIRDSVFGNIFEFMNKPIFE